MGNAVSGPDTVFNDPSYLVYMWKGGVLYNTGVQGPYAGWIGPGWEWCTVSAGTTALWRRYDRDFSVRKAEVSGPGISGHLVGWKGYAIGIYGASIRTWNGAGSVNQYTWPFPEEATYLAAFPDSAGFFAMTQWLTGPVMRWAWTDTPPESWPPQWTTGQISGLDDASVESRDAAVLWSNTSVYVFELLSQGYFTGRRRRCRIYKSSWTNPGFTLDYDSGWTGPVVWSTANVGYFNFPISKNGVVAVAHSRPAYNPPVVSVVIGPPWRWVDLPEGVEGNTDFTFSLELGDGTNLLVARASPGRAVKVRTSDGAYLGTISHPEPFDTIRQGQARSITRYWGLRTRR